MAKDIGGWAAFGWAVADTVTFGQTNRIIAGARALAGESYSQVKQKLDETQAVTTNNHPTATWVGVGAGIVAGAVAGTAATAVVGGAIGAYRGSVVAARVAEALSAADETSQGLAHGQRLVNSSPSTVFSYVRREVAKVTDPHMAGIMARNVIDAEAGDASRGAHYLSDTLPRHVAAEATKAGQKIGAAGGAVAAGTSGGLSVATNAPPQTSLPSAHGDAAKGVAQRT